MCLDQLHLELKHQWNTAFQGLLCPGTQPDSELCIQHLTAGLGPGMCVIHPEFTRITGMGETRPQGDQQQRSQQLPQAQAQYMRTPVNAQPVLRKHAK